MPDHSSNTPPMPVRETNGSPGPSDGEPEKLSGRDRPEREPRNWPDDMAMIPSFFEDCRQVDPAGQSSAEQAHHEGALAQAAESTTGEAQASGTPEFRANATEVSGTTVGQGGQTATSGNGDSQDLEQHHPSAVRNGDPEAPTTQGITEQAGMSAMRNFDFIQRVDPQTLELLGFRTSDTSVPTSAQDGNGQTGTSTGDDWNLLRSPDLQNHSSAPSNGSSPRPSIEDTSEQTTTPEADGLGFLDRFNAQTLLSPASDTGVPTAPSAQAESDTNSNGNSTQPPLQNGDGSTSQSEGMGFIHPLSRELLERLGSGQSTLGNNGDPGQTPQNSPDPFRDIHPILFEQPISQELLDRLGFPKSDRK